MAADLTQREADHARVSDYRNHRISNVHLLCAAFDRLLTAAEYERDQARRTPSAANAPAVTREDGESRTFDNGSRSITIERGESGYTYTAMAAVPAAGIDVQQGPLNTHPYAMMRTAAWLYATPPAAPTPVVTDAMVEVAYRAYAGHFSDGKRPTGWYHDGAMRAAITAALAAKP